MKTVNYSNFRKKLDTYFKQVIDNNEPLIVTTKNPQDNVVVLSKYEYDSLIETLAIQSNKYLMDKINHGRKQVAEAKNKKL